MIGPRVGGAHVDVNLKFDDKSINSVGKLIHRQLATLSKQLAAVGERNRRFYQAIGRDAVAAWRGLLGTIVTSAPLMGSAISGVAGAATMLAGALNSTVKSSFGLLPIITSLGLAGLTASIGMNNFGQAVSEVNPKRLEQLLKDMPKSMQEAVLATRAFNDELRAAIWPRLFAGLGKSIETLRDTGTVQRGLGKMADSMNFLARSVLNYANTKQGVKTLNTFFDNNAKVFRALSKAAVPFLDGFLRLVNALTPAALRLSGRITDIAKSFQSWTREAGFGSEINTMMLNAERTAGLLFKVLGNLGRAINNVFNAANPSTNTFLQMLVDVTQRFEDFTSSVGGRQQIAQWASQSVDVMRQFGRTLEAVFEVIAALADPRVIISFLKTVQEAFEYLSQLPLAKITEAFVSIAEALQPVSSLFLAIIIGAAALNVAIGSLIGQVGGLFAVLIKFAKFKIIVNLFKGTGGAAGQAATKIGFFTRIWNGLLKIFEKVRAAFTRVVGLFTKTGAATGQAATQASKFSRVFKPIMSILGRFVKFAGPVGIAIWIGTIIAKSKDLQAKLGEAWEALKGVFSALGEAFAEIGTALKPLAPVAKATGTALGFIGDILDKIAGFAIGVVIDTITYAFKSLANVIKGLGSIIAGLITFFIALFTLDWSKMWEGLKQIASGIVPLLKGAFGLFVTFFAPAKLAKIGLGLVKGLGSGIAKAAPGILSTVGRFLVTVLKFFATLPFKLLKLGGEALVKLGRGIVAKTPTVIAFAKDLVVKFLRFYVSLPGRLLSLGRKAISKLGEAVVKGAPKVLNAALRIREGVINFIKGLPGSLFSLGKTAVSKLGSAIRSGIGALKGIAKTIVTTVFDIIKALPGKLLGLGGELLSAGKTLGGKILEGIRSGITAIGDMAGSVASSLKAGINSAIGLPKSLNFKVLGKSIGFTIPGFEKGGVAPGGTVLVGEGGPELVNLPRGSRVHSNDDSRKMMQFPDRLILRIGERDFVAYVSEVADERIDAADSLAWQGA